MWLANPGNLNWTVKTRLSILSFLRINDVSYVKTLASRLEPFDFKMMNNN